MEQTLNDEIVKDALLKAHVEYVSVHFTGCDKTYLFYVGSKDDTIKFFHGVWEEFVKNRPLKGNKMQGGLHINRNTCPYNDIVSGKLKTVSMGDASFAAERAEMMANMRQLYVVE
jgi:hypothetical protein